MTIRERLNALEAVEHAILKELGCPTELVALYDFLASGAAPWPKRVAARNLQRARYALHALVAIRDVRHSLMPGRDAAALDAIASLRLQAVAGDVILARENAVLGSLMRQAKKKASQRAAKKRTTKAQTRYADIEQENRKFTADISDRVKAQRIAAKLKIPFGTVRGHLARLKKKTSS